ncbi:hypothetical protein SAMN05444920_104432 [Nonomuraea solani]|uniref:Uncharacterized protein n=1 Tax=Nonomuraea solani TaxID=1144553 RepID=A0A1H6CWY8_9ACTN|nr:hypothetical protein [Nonomuraea solani]SEG76936.1 hypothetical protein SAMN05444920_104432 [Nonomuraea solani]
MTVTPVTPVTLAGLSRQTGLAVLDHLEQSMQIPVIDGLQAQGDLIVVPHSFVADSVMTWHEARWQWVPPEGVELLRGAAGGNPHALVAEPRTCRWTTQVSDASGLTIGMFTATEPVYLLHPEHGGSGCAPGTYVVRRQREQDGRRARLVAD